MSRPNLVLDANGKGLGLLLEHTSLCGQGLCWPTELTGEVGQAQQQPCEAARADSSTQWVRGAGRGRTGLMNSPRQGWSHRLCVKGDFITSEEGIREREAGSSRLKPEDQAWHSGPWKEWQVRSRSLGRTLRSGGCQCRGVTPCLPCHSPPGNRQSM